MQGSDTRGTSEALSAISRALTRYNLRFVAYRGTAPLKEATLVLAIYQGAAQSLMVVIVESNCNLKFRGGRHSSRRSPCGAALQADRESGSDQTRTSNIQATMKRTKAKNSEPIGLAAAKEATETLVAHRLTDHFCDVACEVDL